nr:hypothetical protein BaRGS_006942 [Batillaria attramentaria]
MCEVAAQDGVFQISGFVSRENYSRKDLQFVFVNKRLVLKSKIHKVLNSALGKSTLIKRRVVNVSDKNPSQSNNSEQDKVPVVDASSPTKQFERYGVFVINIDCPFSAYDITFDPAKTLVEFHDWPGVTSLIESMILKFLREENLLLPSEQQQSDATTAAEGCQHVHVSKTPDLLPESVDPFEGDTEEVDEDLLMQQQQKRFKAKKIS